MFSETISLVALLAVHFGFAALLGALMSRAVSLFHGSTLGVASFLYMTATFTLPLALWTKIIVLLISALLFALSAARTPKFLFHPRIGWLYAGLAMSLIFAWTATQGWQTPLLSLGAAAGLAATLAWRRGLGNSIIGHSAGLLD
ncbi:MAG: hypothetical protein WEC37_03745 [Anaerolineales bacterium]